MNGYYLINGTGEYSSGKIQVVFCRFKEPPISESGIGFFRFQIFTEIGITKNVLCIETRLETKIGFAAISSEVKAEQSNFMGMPTSCKDLSTIGHKLNGIYSVKVSQPNTAGTRIESVFCDFQSTDLESKQKLFLGEENKIATRFFVSV